MLPHKRPYDRKSESASSGSSIRNSIIPLVVAVGLVSLLALPTLAGPQDLIPDSISVTLVAGQSFCESKSAEVNGFIPRGDIVFSFDVTNSMLPVIDQVKADAVAIMNNLNGVFGDVRFGVSSHMDYPDSFDVCGYTANYGRGYSGDYPYNLDIPLTDNITDVSNTINGLVSGHGGDQPEDYTRVFYESYADDNFGFRPEAKKILINFGDNVPHDCNLNEGFPGATEPDPWTTGADPGRDAVMGTPDDLDLQTVLGEMFANDRTLLEIHRTDDYQAYWEHWTGITGGQLFILDDNVAVISAAIQQMVEDEANYIALLTLEVCTPGFESWLTSVEPVQYTDLVAPITVNFDIAVTVPPGTPEGVYTFSICAIGDGAVMGEQVITITVVGNQPPVALCHNRTVNADDNCQADADINDGSFDPDDDPVVVTVDPAGPYPLGATLVTLIIQDDPEPVYDSCADIFIDLPSFADTCQATVTIVDSTSPVCSVPNDTALFQCQPAEICLPVGCSDNCDADPTLTVVSGPGAIAGGNWCYTPSGDESFTVTTRCEDDAGNFCEATFSVSVVTNKAPSVSCPSNMTVHWGDFVNATATATDPEDDNITFSLGWGTPGAIDPVSGQYTWQPLQGDICVNEIEIIATDDCGRFGSCKFLICVQNDPPELACPDDTAVIWGDLAVGTVSATDPDEGPYALLYSLVSFDGPGMMSVNPATGEYTWETQEDPEYLGTYELCVAVTDSANTCESCSPANADTCCFNISVIPSYSVYIEKTHNTLQGQYEHVSIYLDSSYTAMEIGGYNFLVDYDASVLNFIKAEPGQFIIDCGWEYFTYRYGPNGNCGPSACPTGKLRVVALAETNNGTGHPTCFTNDEGISSVLADLTFLVSNNRNLECQYVPIRFFWYECGDNTLSSRVGDTLYLSRFVYAYDNPIPINNPSVPFPTYQGADNSCDVFEKTAPRRRVDYFFGGIDIVCADSIDARGDVNLNGIAYEVADAVMFTNYFINGLGAFGDHIEGSIAATDVNADGIPLSVADLVWLIRVVVGDADPIPKVNPVTATFGVDDGIISVSGNMGAAYVVVAGSVEPKLLAENMQMIYRFDGDKTRILVYSLESGAAFSGDFLQVEGELISIEMATYRGAPVVAKPLPTGYSLSQNYPNPFNPSTTISFTLPYGGRWDLSIFNVAGQEVAEFSGSAEPGPVTQTWDASAHASGVFFYRLEADGFSTTRKMILLK
jgi:hypothetical protein